MHMCSKLKDCNNQYFISKKQNIIHLHISNILNIIKQINCIADNDTDRMIFIKFMKYANNFVVIQDYFIVDMFI